MGEGRADELFAQTAGDRAQVPEPAAPCGKVSVADGDFLAVVGPMAGIAQAAAGALGDQQWVCREGHPGLKESEIKIVVGLNVQSEVKGAVILEKRPPVERGLMVYEIAAQGRGGRKMKTEETRLIETNTCENGSHQIGVPVRLRWLLDDSAGGMQGARLQIAVSCRKCLQEYWLDVPECKAVEGER